MITLRARRALLATLLFATVGCADEEPPQEVAGTGTAGGNPSATVSFALSGESEAAGVRWSGAEFSATGVAVGRRQEGECAFEPPDELADPLVFGSSEIAGLDPSGLCGLRLYGEPGTPLLRVEGTRDGREALLLTLPDTVEIRLPGLDADESSPVQLAVVLDVSRLLATLPIDELLQDDGRLRLDDREPVYGARLRINTFAALSVWLDPTPADGTFSPEDLLDARRVGGVFAVSSGESER